MGLRWVTLGKRLITMGNVKITVGNVKITVEITEGNDGGYKEGVMFKGW